MKKRKKKEKIKYHEPPMKYNIALHKFEVDLPKVNKENSKKIDYRLLLYPFIGTILGLLIKPYFPNNIFLLFTQIFQVNLISNLFNVEWKPWNFF